MPCRASRGRGLPGSGLHVLDEAGVAAVGEGLLPRVLHAVLEGVVVEQTDDDQVGLDQRPDEVLHGFLLG